VSEKSPPRISNSFNLRELRVFNTICRTAMRGGDIRVMASSPEFSALWAKVRAMLARVEQQVAQAEFGGFSRHLDDVPAAPGVAVQPRLPAVATSLELAEPAE
jgi:hypothetical protein